MKEMYDALARVEHPELKGHNLVELGMIEEYQEVNTDLIVDEIVKWTEQPAGH